MGDKTGTGYYFGTTNDVAVIWPPKCNPIVLIDYYSSNKKEAPKREDLLASATRIVLNEFGKTDSCIGQVLQETSRIASHGASKTKPAQILQTIMIPATKLGMEMGIAELPPNSAKGRHLHTNVELAYILEGEVILSIDGKPDQIFRKGEIFQHPAYVIHDTKAGPNGAKVLATWIFEPGKAVSMPAK